MSSAQNFPDSIAISYKENYWDKEVRKITRFNVDKTID